MDVEITLSDLEVVKWTPKDIPGAFIENKSKVLAEMYTTGFYWIINEKANEVRWPYF